MLVMSQVCLVTGLFWNISATRVIIIKFLLLLFLFCFAFLSFFSISFFFGGERGAGGGVAGNESSLS